MKRRTTTTRATAVRRAFTLVELSMVLIGLGVATGLLAAALWGWLRLDRSSAQALDRLRIQQLLADQFRNDVAGADDAPERWQDEVAGPTCLILAAESRHIVYRWNDQRLVRTEWVGGKAHNRDLALGWGPDGGAGARGGTPDVAFESGPRAFSENGAPRRGPPPL